ncbi:hypothetical protein GJ700_12665 [Duganella sp. FT92W]|uniref:Uncharacterized protein n=1 Tax=Pseudoduganella rivuli TaxID=2666085 RepID=A0A7X2IMH9_9BURK|nr:hypothetical protein [Pseudoduganella rivuli]MRV72560.1 hypothetical protein [Pseudoduganella rivuli]
MKIKMISTTPGSVDGIRVTTYLAGETYDLGGNAGECDLAAAFVAAGLATEAPDDDPVTPQAGEGGRRKTRATHAG